MAHWLFKEEPSHYAFSDLVREGRTEWEGVRNPQARKNLRGVRRDDTAFFYHTGNERAIVGVMEVVEASRPSTDHSTASVSATVKPVRALRNPVTLVQLRSDRQLAGFDLLRIPRLSIVPVSDEQWRRILRHESRPMTGGGRSRPG